MRCCIYNLNHPAHHLLLLAASAHFCAAAPSTGPLSKRDITDTTYLPAQIGGIVGAYAFCLVLVAVLLLALSKKRRDHLRNGDDPDALIEPSFNPFPAPFLLQSEEAYKRNLQQFPYPAETPKSPYKNFSLPSNGPLSPSKSQTSPTSTITHLTIGVDLSVDQTIVARDREMAQQQLEDMYKYVMEQEEAKEEGRVYEGPLMPSPQSKPGTPGASSAPTGILKKERNKPSSLNLGQDKTQSRTSSILSVLKSPRKKAMKGVSISSPIMTPMSGTFPRHESQEMNPISPRQYAPPPPPPIPTDQLPFRRDTSGTLPLTPEMSPVNTQMSLNERIDAAFGVPPSPERRVSRENKKPSHSRDVSTATASTNDPEPVSAVSERSTTNLVGLPTSPKPGVNRFPSLSSLPKSPTPGQSFPRFNAPSAVRTGGTLPLRAYEPALASPSVVSQETKQTVFTRAPMSPGMHTGGLRTPWTGAPVPYSPYQPFSPVVPITPSLVTREDRKRMKKLEPKTPTLEMVQSSDEIW